VLQIFSNANGIELAFDKHVLKKKRKDLASIDGGDLYNPTEEPNPAPTRP